MLRTESSPEVVTAWLSGEIDHHSAKEMRETIDREIERWRPTLLILDFRDVSFMDSSGIGLVMGRYKNMSFIGGEVRVTNCSPCIYKVMKVAGLDRLAEITRQRSVSNK